MTQPPLVLVTPPPATLLTGISFRLLCLFLFPRDPSALIPSVGSWHCSFRGLMETTIRLVSLRQPPHPSVPKLRRHLVRDALPDTCSTATRSQPQPVTVPHLIPFRFLRVGCQNLIYFIIYLSIYRARRYSNKKKKRRRDRFSSQAT